MLYGKLNTASINIRSGAGNSYSDIGDLVQDDYLIASESLGGWWHLKDAKHGGWTGAPVVLADKATTVAMRAAKTNDVWCLSAYIRAVDPPVVAPPPPPPPPVSARPHILFNLVAIDVDGKKYGTVIDMDLDPLP